MLQNVLALVRPNNSSLAFERTNMSANFAINKWIGLVMPIIIGAAYASAMITARPRAIAGRPGRGDVLGAASLDALTPAATAAGEAARALHSFCSSRAISEESVTTTAV